MFDGIGKTISYLWERKRVIAKLANSWISCLIGEPFSSRANPGTPTIIFVRRTARTRFHNHAMSLRSQGVQSILVANAFDYPYQKKAFVEIHPWLQVTSIPSKVKRLIKRHNVVAVIASVQPARQGELLLEMDLSVPLIIDHHDSAWSQSYFQQLELPVDGAWLSQSEVAAEERCFRNADGVIARSGELVELFKENGVSTPTEVLEDCCSPELFQPVVSHGSPKKVSGWSIAYAGALFSLGADPATSYPCFTPYASCFAKAQIHLHMYPSPMHEYSYPDYHQESKNNPWFHLHASVGFNEVQHVLSQYDFGLINAERPENYQLFSDVHFRNHVHAKFHSYLEAGLPIIVPSCFEREAELVREWEMGLVFDKLHQWDLRLAIANSDVAFMRKQVAKARESMTATRQSIRMFSFIKSLFREK